MTERSKMVLALLVTGISLLAIVAFISLMVAHRKQNDACQNLPATKNGISVQEAYCTSVQQ